MRQSTMMYRPQPKTYKILYCSLFFLKTILCHANENQVANKNLTNVMPFSNEYLLEIEINHVLDFTPVLSYVVNDNSIKIPISVFKKNKIDVDGLVEEDGYIDLETIPWVESHIDLKTQKLDIHVPADKFKKNNIFKTESSKELEIKFPGTYMNYDATAQYYADDKIKSLGGTSELIHFNKYGIGTFSSLATTQSIVTPRFLRLETNWTFDQHKDLACWKFGDSISRASDWSGSLRFAGLQYATKFSLQPQFVTFPLPSFKGQAVVPSNIDIFLQDALQASHNIERGPFEIYDLPVMTGQGNISLVTRDILGRQQTISIPYHVSPDFLKSGLKDYSFEIGIIRQDYGLKSNKYDQGLIVGTYRQGIKDQWTLGGHSELTKDLQNLGLTNQYLIHHYGIFTQSIAVSHNASGIGNLVSLSADHQNTYFNLGLKVEKTQGPFTRLGLYQEDVVPWLTLQGFVGFSPEKFGNFSMSYTERHTRDCSPLSLVTVNYQKTLKSNLSLSFYSIFNLQNRENQQIGLSLSWMIGNKSQFNSVTQAQRGNSSQKFEFVKNKDLESPYGYYLSTLQGNQTYYEAGGELETKYGNHEMRVSQENRVQNIEIDSQGSIIFFDNKFLLSKPIHNSFALIQTPHLKNIPIYESNRLIGETDDEGNLIVSPLRPYEENTITLDAKHLPLNKSLKTDQISVVPMHRAGTIVKFPLETSYVYTFNLLDQTDQQFPAGTILKEQYSNKKYYVGLEGEVCLILSSKEKELKFIVQGTQQCQFSISIPENTSDVHELGSYKCN